MYSYIIAPFLKSLRALKFYVERIEPVIDIKKSLKECIDDDILFNNTIYAATLRYVIKSRESGHNYNLINFENSSLNKEIQNSINDLIEQFDSLIVEDNVDGHISYNIPGLPLDIKKEYQNLESREKQNKILYSGSLMLLITYFENLISRIFYKDFLMYPKRISLNTKCVSYKTLEDVGDIDEIKNYLIEEEVITMMYKSFADWINYFKKNMNLKLKYIDEKDKMILEIISRRNLFVHNDGVVNSIYLNLVGDSNIKWKKGDIIEIDRSYIDIAIQVIEYAGVSIVLEVWLKGFEKLEDEVDKIFEIIYEEYLLQEKWDAAKYFYEIILDCKKILDADKLLCKINRWQCYKWLNRFEEVREEVEKIDISASSPKYKLGILALTDKYDEFFEVYDTQNEIMDCNLKEWPLFKMVRESKEYRKRYTEIVKNNDEILSEEKASYIEEQTNSVQ